MVKAKKKVLLVDKDDATASFLTMRLSKEGYLVTHSQNGEKALDLIIHSSFDILLLELILPGMDGFEFIRRLKYVLKMDGLPIIALTAKNDEVDVIAAYKLGVDDYVTKPFKYNELAARIRAVLRRASKEADGDAFADIHSSGIEINPAARTIKIQDKLITLTHMEFRIIKILTSNPGWVFSRTQIINSAKGNNFQITERSVDVQIAGLRKKLGTWGRKNIETVRNVGYRFRKAN